MSKQKLIRSCLYNWLGYGNINGETWFVGKEEGGAEIRRKNLKFTEGQAMFQSLQRRSRFQIAMDFEHVWRDLHGYGEEYYRMIRGNNNVWRFIAAFYLYNNKGRISSKTPKEMVNDRITKFLQDGFGSKNENFFFCEFLPLPRRNKDTWPELYTSVWETADEYHRELMPKRFALIHGALLRNRRLRRIVSFDKRFTGEFLNRYQVNGDEEEKKWPSTKIASWIADDGKKYAIYDVKMEDGRTVKFLDSPFFGYMSYYPTWYSKHGLPYAASKI